jgi:tetratricopeptide (TPR) repeat protein
VIRSTGGGLSILKKSSLKCNHIVTLNREHYLLYFNVMMMNALEIRSRPASLIVSACLLLVFCSAASVAQTKGQNPKIRLAQTYEQSGKYEEAAQLYWELHASDESNVVFFDGLRRMYLQLKRYDDAIALLRNRILMYPAEVTLRAQLGSVLYKAGREREANDEWEGAISIDPDNAGSYRTVASVLVENRLLDKTAELYRKARVACGDEYLFTLELAQLLGTSMDFHGAMTEYVRWLKKNPAQLSFVENKLAGLSLKEHALRISIDVVRAAVDRGGEPVLSELLAWLLLEDKDYDQAFEVYRRLNRESKEHGARMFAFAERAFREKSFDVAAQAYLEAIGSLRVPAKIPAAKFGYASCLKELLLLSDLPRSQGTKEGSDATKSAHYADAVKYFQEIIAEYPRREFSARAYFEIGVLQFERLHDPGAALQSLMAGEHEISGQNTFLSTLELYLGRVQTAMGDTSAASSRFRVVSKAFYSTPDQQDEAMYRLAELEYFRGQFDSAETILSDITLNLHADYANDALRLRAFLEENSKTARVALTEFARAEFLARRLNHAEARELFTAIIDRYPNALLVDDALMKVAQLQADDGLHTEAISTYERVLNDFGATSIVLDRAQFRIGEIYHYGLNDKPNAIAAYERLLAEFPESLHVTEARKRIRELRGESS